MKQEAMRHNKHEKLKRNQKEAVARGVQRQSNTCGTIRRWASEEIRLRPDRRKQPVSSETAYVAASVQNEASSASECWMSVS